MVEDPLEHPAPLALDRVVLLEAEFLIAFLNVITIAKVMQVAVILVEVPLWIHDEALGSDPVLAVPIHNKHRWRRKSLCFSP